MASRPSYKNPPVLGDDTQYEAWVKEVNLWSLCCKLDKEEQGPALALSLSGNARQAAMDIDMNTLNSDGGLQAVINKLDGLYLKDVNQRIYVALKTFESFKRTDDCSMDKYLNEFDLKYNKLKAHGIVLPDVVLGYRMLESANLTKSRSELVRISAIQMTYNQIKTQLRKLEDIAVSSCDEPSIHIKTENDTYYTSEHPENDVLYNRTSNFRGGNRFNSDRGGRVGRSRGGRAGYSRGSRGRFDNRGGYDNRGRGAYNSGRGRDGQSGRGRGACYVCGKFDHRAWECPDRYDKENQNDENDGEEEAVFVDIEV